MCNLGRGAVRRCYDWESKRKSEQKGAARKDVAIVQNHRIRCAVIARYVSVSHHVWMINDTRITGNSLCDSRTLQRMNVSGDDEPDAWIIKLSERSNCLRHLLIRSDVPEDEVYVGSFGHSQTALCFLTALRGRGIDAEVVRMRNDVDRPSYCMGLYHAPFSILRMDDYIVSQAANDARDYGLKSRIAWFVRAKIVDRPYYTYTKAAQQGQGCDEQCSIDMMCDDTFEWTIAR
jgi:hypothetical protein